jgi:uncharacterized protein YtpQ (UPF0354 family)
MEIESTGKCNAKENILIWGKKKDDLSYDVLIHMTLNYSTGSL